MNYKLSIGLLIGWLFGFIVLAIGLLNTFWGNDTLVGIAFALMSFLYFPPSSAMIEKIIGFRIPIYLKIILGILILWGSLGVGELFDKIELMKQDL